MTRINKVVASLWGVGRRKADEYIEYGEVTIDGSVVDQAGYRVADGAVVGWDGEEKIWGDKPHRYVVYFKPIEIECTFSESQSGYGTMEFWHEEDVRFRYGGRLDAMSEGLMVLSTDGAWLNKLTHPSYNVAKNYVVRTRDAHAIADATTQWVESDGEQISLGEWKLMRDINERDQIWDVILYQGINRHIRRVVRAYDGRVLRLRRMAIGPYQLGQLQPNEWIELTPEDAYTMLDRYHGNS